MVSSAESMARVHSLDGSTSLHSAHHVPFVRFMVFSKHRFLYWFLLIAYCGLIFYLSSRPALHVSHDKIIHTLEYAFLGFLISAALRHYFHLRALGLALAVVGLATLFGISDEIHQYFVPGRECSVWDALADFFGSMMGVLFYVAVHRLQRVSTANS